MIYSYNGRFLLNCLCFTLTLIIFNLFICSYANPAIKNTSENKVSEPAEQTFEDKEEPIDSSNEYKRAWNKLQSSWGKRAWQNLQGSWGKRNMFPMSNDYLERNNDKWYLNDKRAWNNLHSAGWGKRTSNDWEPEIDNDYTAQQLNEYDPSIIRSGLAMAENDYYDNEEKRSWKNSNGLWGKREPNRWSKFRGSWGKREPAWNNLKGLWG